MLAAMLLASAEERHFEHLYFIVVANNFGHITVIKMGQGVIVFGGVTALRVIW